MQLPHPTSNRALWEMTLVSSSFAMKSYESLIFADIPIFTYYTVYTIWLPPTCDSRFCPIETGPCPQHLGHGLAHNSTQQNLVRRMNEWTNLEMDHKFPRLFPGDAAVKKPTCQCKRHKRHGFDPCVGKIPLKKRMTTHSPPVLLLGKFHQQRSLVGCSPWGHKVSDTTEWLSYVMQNISTT